MDSVFFIKIEKDYYDIGVEFNDIKEVIEKLADGQGIMFWFMYYNKSQLRSVLMQF